MNQFSFGSRATDDTDGEAQRRLVEGYRAMPPWRKYQVVQELNRRVTAAALADIRRRHPNATDRDNQFRLAARRMDPELLRKHFGWDIREHGY
jgi:hypothetical protein